MGETADRIRQEVEATRDDASQKISEIEARVEGASHQVKESVEEAKQQVKETLDLRRQIEANPLLAVGVAFAGGFALGGMFGGEDHEDRRHAGYEQYQMRPQHRAEQPSGVMETVRKAARSSGIDDTLNKAVESLVASLGDRLRTIGEQSFLDLMQKGQDHEVTRRTTTGSQVTSSSADQPHMPTATPFVPETDRSPASAGV
jgi:ElaB/YqjD/DUF883 family membrane-anchored ribosome-binding protein